PKLLPLRCFCLPMRARQRSWLPMASRSLTVSSLMRSVSSSSLAPTPRWSAVSRLCVIADSATAPYGTAAVEVMKALGVYDVLARKIVQGSNIAQTFQFVETGNTELGFVALSQVIAKNGGSRWMVPTNMYSTIRQDAVLLRGGADSEAANAFLAFMK